MKRDLRDRRLRELLEQFPRRVLYGAARAADGAVPWNAYKDELLDRLCALPAHELERALAAAIARRDLQAMCRRLGMAATGAAGALAARLVAAVDDGEARVSRWRSFEDARAFARGLQLASQAQWYARMRAGGRPEDIPLAPNQTYAGRGWTSWGDFLGTHNPARHLIAYRPFAEARAYARSLGLPNFDAWRAHCKKRVGNRRIVPADIPAAPYKVYAEWVSAGDWLGTGRVHASKVRYRSYAEARRFVRALGITTEPEWRAYCRGELFPDKPRPLDVPSNPQRTYKRRGWSSWGAFFGTGNVALYKRKFRSFRAARAYVRALRLADNSAWRAWSRSSARPGDIPSSPDVVYRDRGWTSWGDFLGTGHVHPGRVQRRTFREARAFVRTLGLTSATDYARAWKAGRIPRDIPRTIDKHAAWRGWPDFLGPSFRGQLRRARRKRALR